MKQTLLAGYLKTKAAKLLRKKGFSVYNYNGKLKVKTPKGIQQLQISDAKSVVELVSNFENVFRPKEQIYNEPPDDAVIKKSGSFREEKLPETYAHYILPKGGNIGGKRVNIDRIKQWIQEVKLKGQTNSDLLNEYNDLKGRKQDTPLTAKQKHDMADSMAYKISRKIWYVGRRPSSLTDDDWQQMTSKLRPVEGSYSRNEKWVTKFPYTQAYIYESGS